MQVEYDLELIAKWNRIDLLNEGMKNRRITEYKLVVEKKYNPSVLFIWKRINAGILTTRWGDEILRKDKYGVSTTHMAARNGYLEILKFLEKKKCIESEKEERFLTSALDLSIAMKHNECFDFLISRFPKEMLGWALSNVSAEGNVSIAKKLVSHGVDLEFKDEFGATPLDSIYLFL